MTQLPEAVFWLAVGSTPYRTFDPDGEEQLCCFLTSLHAADFLMDVEPFRNSVLKVYEVQMAQAFKYAQDSGTKMLVGLELVWDPAAPIN